VGGHKEQVKVAECSGNITHSYTKMEKMRQVETIPRMGGVKENDGRGKSNYNIL
jgi:hypothetical protein